MRRRKAAIEAEALATFKQVRFAPLSEHEPIKYIEARRLELTVSQGSAKGIE
jgi:hypothetical protein